jgi:hypothetical protein
MLRDPGFFLFIVATIAGITVRYWHRLRRMLRGAESRNWPALTATIDIVSVVMVGSADEVVGYTGTLTYFYRNPELQVGEFQRQFSLKSAAENWVEQFKSRSVMVRVNPKRPVESVLLEEDVQAITLRPAPGIEEALLMEKIPELPRGYRILSTISEMVGMAGLAVSATVFFICLRRGGEPVRASVLWSIAAMLAFTVISMFVVVLRAEDEDEYHSFSRRFSIWCPAWMRWALSIGGGIFAIFWLIAKIDPGLAKYLLLGTGSLLPILWLGWCLLITTGFHLAIVRSQGHSRPALGGNLS